MLIKIKGWFSFENTKWEEKLLAVLINKRVEESAGGRKAGGWKGENERAGRWWEGGDAKIQLIGMKKGI